MATQFIESDVHGLVRLAQLVERFNRNPTAPVAAELRIQEARFGLSPTDRLRLRWTVDPSAPEAEPDPFAEFDEPVEGPDPRLVLRDDTSNDRVVERDPRGDQIPKRKPPPDAQGPFCVGRRFPWFRRRS